MQPPTPAKQALISSLAGQFLRFGSIGFLCFLCGLALVFILTEWLRLHYLLSMAIALLVMNFVGWLLNRHWTFASRARRSWAEFARYLLVNAAGFVLTLLLLEMMVSWLGLNYLVASAFIAVLMAGLNFTAHRLWSLRGHDSK
jgi:putative flippase GtrA